MILFMTEKKLNDLIATRESKLIDCMHALQRQNNDNYITSANAALMGRVALDIVRNMDPEKVKETLDLVDAQGGSRHYEPTDADIEIAKVLSGEDAN